MTNLAHGAVPTKMVPKHLELLSYCKRRKVREDCQQELRPWSLSYIRLLTNTFGAFRSPWTLKTEKEYTVFGARKTESSKLTED